MRTRRSKDLSATAATYSTDTGTGVPSVSRSSAAGAEKQQTENKRRFRALEDNNIDPGIITFKFSWDELDDKEEDNVCKSAPSKILKRDQTLVHSPIKTSFQSQSQSDANTASANNGTSRSFPTMDNTNASSCSDVMEVVSVKNEDENSESDEDQENSNYMQIRMKNMKDNENFLASIGVFKAKEELKQAVVSPKKKKNVNFSQRGLKVIKVPVEPLPRRKSFRINKLDALGNPLPNPDNDHSQSQRSLDTIPFGQLMFHKIHKEEVKLPEGPITMKDCVYSNFDKDKASDVVDQFCTFIHTDLEKKYKNMNKKLPDNSFEDGTLFDKMSLTEVHVAKVVPERVFSLDWYQSTDKLLVAAGDRCGHIGFWNVMGEEKDGSEIVTAFKPHVNPVTQLLFSRSHKQNLYSCSFDGTLRCLDFEKCVFNEVLSIPEEDDLLRDFSFVDSNVMVVAHHTGCVSVVDVRTSSTSAESSYMASKKNLQSIHVNPQSSNHFITTGADATINLWDFRQVNRKSPKPLDSVQDHSKTVSSAYFSPNGQQIVSCSGDDTILIYSVQNSTKAHLAKRLRHNNYTGRWLTRFRPTWHPTIDNVFVSGSMARPRRIEIFNSNGGSLISCLESDNLNSVCSLNKFHPMIPTTLAGANSSGRLHVFM